MGAPKAPKVKPVPPPPPPEKAVDEALSRARDDRRRIAMAQAGRAGTLATGGQGAAGAATLGGSTLLGAG